MIPALSWSSHHWSTPAKYSNWLNRKYFELNSCLRINIIIVIFISNNFSLLGLSPNVLITFTKHETLNTEQYIFKMSCKGFPMWQMWHVMVYSNNFYYPVVSYSVPKKLLVIWKNQMAKTRTPGDADVKIQFYALYSGWNFKVSKLQGQWVVVAPSYRPPIGSYITDQDWLENILKLDADSHWGSS